MCEYLLLIPIDVPSFKLIEGQIKKLHGVVPNTPPAENDQKSPGRIGLILASNVKYHFRFEISTYNLSPEPYFSQIRPEIKTFEISKDKVA